MLCFSFELNFSESHWLYLHHNIHLLLRQKRQNNHDVFISAKRSLINVAQLQPCPCAASSADINQVLLQLSSADVSTGGIFFSDYILDPKCSLGVATYIQYDFSEFSNSFVQGKKKPQGKDLWEEELYMYVMRNLFHFCLDLDLSLPSEVSQDTPIHSC